MGYPLSYKSPPRPRTNEMTAAKSAHVLEQLMALVLDLSVRLVGVEDALNTPRSVARKLANEKPEPPPSRLGDYYDDGGIAGYDPTKKELF